MAVEQHAPGPPPAHQRGQARGQYVHHVHVGGPSAFRRSPPGQVGHPHRRAQSRSPSPQHRAGQAGAPDPDRSCQDPVGRTDLVEAVRG